MTTTSEINLYVEKVLYLLKHLHGYDKVKVLHEAEERLLLQDIAEIEKEQGQ